MVSELYFNKAVTKESEEKGQNGKCKGPGATVRCV